MCIRDRCGLDHVAPFDDIGLDQRAHGFRRAWSRFDPLDLQSPADFGTVDGRDQRRVELIHDIGRHSRGHHDRGPERGLAAGHAAFRHGGDIGKHGIARVAHDRERSDRAFAHLLQRRRNRADRQVDAALNEVERRLRRTAVRHVHDVDVGAALEQLAGKVRERAGAGRGVAELAGLRLGEAHELGECLHRQLPRRHEHERRAADHADRREIPERVERQPRGQRLARGMGGGVGKPERVSVRRRLGDHIGADDRAAADAVVHHDLLAEPVPHFGRDDAGDGVGAAAGAERNHQPQRPVRPRGGTAVRRGAEHQRQNRQQKQNAAKCGATRHGGLSVCDDRDFGFRAVLWRVRDRPLHPLRARDDARAQQDRSVAGPGGVRRGRRERQHDDGRAPAQDHPVRDLATAQAARKRAARHADGPQYPTAAADARRPGAAPAGGRHSSSCRRAACRYPADRGGSAAASAHCDVRDARPHARPRAGRGRRAQEASGECGIDPAGYGCAACQGPAPTRGRHRHHVERPARCRRPRAP